MRTFISGCGLLRSPVLHSGKPICSICKQTMGTLWVEERIDQSYLNTKYRLACLHRIDYF